MFCARAWIFTEKNATSKIIKKSPKNQFPPGGAVFALAPPSPKPTPPKGHFWRYLRCFMHIEQSSKMTVFLPPGRGSAAAARPPIAKAKAKLHAMRSNMPGIRCLLHRRIIKGYRPCRRPLMVFYGRRRRNHETIAGGYGQLGDQCAVCEPFSALWSHTRVQNMCGA